MSNPNTARARDAGVELTVAANATRPGAEPAADPDRFARLFPDLDISSLAAGLRRLWVTNYEAFTQSLPDVSDYVNDDDSILVTSALLAIQLPTGCTVGQAEAELRRLLGG